MHVSKLDAALRQLETAIRMFFLNGDPIAIHTLTAAARTILGDLSKAGGKQAGLDNILAQGIRPEKLGEFLKLLKQAQNFFKHADKDPDQLLDFNPAQTEILLWDACVLYGALTGHQHPLITLFSVWFAASHPEILTPEKQAEVAQVPIPYDLNNRRLFFEEMLPLAEVWIAGQH